MSLFLSNHQAAQMGAMPMLGNDGMPQMQQVSCDCSTTTMGT